MNTARDALVSVLEFCAVEQGEVLVDEDWRRLPSAARCSAGSSKKTSLSICKMSCSAMVPAQTKLYNVETVDRVGY